MSKYNKEQSGSGKPSATSAPLKTSLRDLSEFHPRLSMRAAVSTKIDEDALNLIQQHQNQQISSPIRSPAVSLSSETLQGSDLIQNLTKYVGSDGLIKESVDIKEYAELMQCEVSSSHQLLLLKIIVATLKNNEAFSTKLIQCEGLMIVLGLWLTSVEQEKLLESVLVEKILEILSLLTFTIDLLVKYKFGRVIKKITQQKVTAKSKPVNFEMASKLFDEWSELANKPEIPTVPRRKSEESINDIEIVIKPPSPVAQPIVPEPKPAIKRLSPELHTEEVKRTKMAPLKKSVKFPESDEDLCKYFVFERAPEEYEFLSDGSASRDSYLHADKGEALVAFEHSNDSDESLESLTAALKPWKQLESLEGVSFDQPDGMDSEEKIIQRQRERTVLSINYFSLGEVPPSPSEVDVDDVSSEDVYPPKTISIRPNETIVKHSFNFKFASAVKSLEISSFFTPEMMNNFVPPSSAFSGMLNPFSNTKSNMIAKSIGTQDKTGNTSPAYRPTSAPYTPEWFGYAPKNASEIDPNTSTAYRPTRPAYTPDSIWLPSASKPKVEPSSPAYSPYSPPYNPPRSPPRKTGSKGKHWQDEHSPPYVHPADSQWNAYRANGSNVNSGSGYSSKSICRYYKPGMKKSCRRGSNCSFIHQD